MFWVIIYKRSTDIIVTYQSLWRPVSYRKTLDKSFRYFDNFTLIDNKNCFLDWPPSSPEVRSMNILGIIILEPSKEDKTGKKSSGYAFMVAQKRHKTIKNLIRGKFCRRKKVF